MHARQDVSKGAASPLMDLGQLRSHIRTLITLDETPAPFVSCYVDRVGGRNSLQPHPFDRRVQAIRKVLGRQELDDFDEAFGQLQHYLATDLRSTTRGVSLFVRAGTQPFFLGLQFQVPLPNRLSVSSTPDIFHLVELKDTYHRYMLLILTEESARILEVNLGAVTREAWTERPELRKRVGTMSTREHYQNHRRDRGTRFLKEKIEILEKIVAKGGHTHLILAGSPQVTGRIVACLPKTLQAMLVDVVPASARAQVADVVAATLSSFIEREQQESLDAVAELQSALRRGGLGTAGSAPTFEALRWGLADVLVIARAYESPPTVCCRQCGYVDTKESPPDRCPDCDSTELQSANLRELMVKLAEWQSIEVEVVEHSDVLMDLGGVGCLLRYVTPEPSQST